MRLDARGETAQRCLLPKTVRLDHGLNDRMVNMWRRLARICGDSLCITDDRATLSLDRLRNEAEVTSYLHVHLFDPLRRSFDGLSRQANSQPSVSTLPEDQRILLALRQATGSSVLLQDNRFVIDSPSHDTITEAATRLDAGVLADGLLRNVAAHVVASGAPDPEGASPDPPTQAAQRHQHTHMPFGRRTPDISLCWYPVLSDEDTEVGVPFYTVEVKDPRRISYSEIYDCITRFGSSIVKNRSVFAQDIQDFRTTGAMNVRFLLNRKDPPFNVVAKCFWEAVGRHYQSMFASRQTFGGFNTGMTGVNLRIDWDHPTEPGQNLYVSIIDCTNNTMLPRGLLPPVPPLPHFRRDLFSVSHIYAALQFETGLVPMPRFEEAVRLLTARRANPGALGAGGSGGAAAPGSSRDVANPGGGSTPASGAQRRNPPRSSTNKRPASAINDAPAAKQPRLSSSPTPPSHRHSILGSFIDCITDSQCRSEIQRYLDLDETKFALPFAKEDLPKVLCSAFRLDRDLARAASRRTKKQPHPPKFTSPPPLPGFPDYESQRLFKWYSLKDGCVPRALNSEIARLDELERSAAAISARAQSPTPAPSAAWVQSGSSGGTTDPSSAEGSTSSLHGLETAGGPTSVLSTSSGPHRSPSPTDEPQDGSDSSLPSLPTTSEEEDAAPLFADVPYLNQQPAPSADHLSPLHSPFSRAQDVAF